MERCFILARSLTQSLAFCVHFTRYKREIFLIHKKVSLIADFVYVILRARIVST